MEYRGREVSMSADTTLVKDLVCGMMIDPKTAAATRVYEGKTYYFCAQGCAKSFEKDPKKYITA